MHALPAGWKHVTPTEAVVRDRQLAFGIFSTAYARHTAILT
jgi:hypothetical protein